MQFFVFVILLVVAIPSICHGITADQLAVQCFQRWNHVPQGSKTAFQGRCLRLKIVSKCWLRTWTTDSNNLVDLSKFVTEQQAIFSNILGICEPVIDVSKLTNVVELSGIKDKYSAFIVDNDEPAQCATDAYRDCLVQYDKLYTNGKLCNDAASFYQCMQEKSKDCNADILLHMIQIFDKWLSETFAKANANAELKQHLCVRE